MKSLKEVSLGLLSGIASTIIILGAILVAMTEGIALSIPTVEPTFPFPVIEDTVLPGTIAPTRTPSPTSQRPFIVTITPTGTCKVNPPPNWGKYPIQSGDKLSELAQRFGISLSELKTVNCLNSVTSDTLMGASTLVLPLPTPTPTFTVTMTRTLLPTFTLVSVSGTCKATPSNWVRYVVQSGDNLFRLSLSVGMDWHDVMTANCLVSQFIVTGQVLYLPRLPARSPTATSTSRPTTAPTPVPTQVISKTPTRTPLPVYHKLTVNKAGAGSGLVTSNPAGIDCGSTCSFSFTNGTPVTLNSSAATGSTFSGWSGGGCTGTAPCVMSLTADTSVTANFTQNQYTLTVVSDHGPVSKVPDQPSYTYGQTVVLTMGTVDAGWAFTGWSGGGCTGTAPCTVTMNANTTVTANFTQNQYTLTVVSSHGSVSKAPDQATYTHGQQVVLTMGTVDAGWTFTGWSGGGCTGTAPCTVTMTADTTVTANFTQIQYTLTVVTSHGPVSKAPDQATYTHGQQVVLTMGTVDAGWTFTGWSGGGCTGTAPCTVTMTANTTVTANFTQNQYTLTVVSSHGSVSKSPEQATYTLGQQVVLTMGTVDAGWTFTGWSGGGCTGTAPCTVTMTADTTVTSNFTQP